MKTTYSMKKGEFLTVSLPNGNEVTIDAQGCGALYYRFAKKAPGRLGTRVYEDSGLLVLGVDVDAKGQSVGVEVIP